jgi:signal transduction histidine kinase
MEPNDLTLAGLIHDLNNVFQTLVEAADLLSEDPQWKDLSAVIERSVERGKELTQGLQKTEQPPASIGAVLNGARSFVEDLLVAARGPSIEFSCHVDDSIELRRALSWERVFVNLFSNSVRAMPEGGTIFVRAQRAGSSIEIVVADDGPGIAPELLANIFEPHVSSRREGGLGLHIVESIVKENHGCVRAGNGGRGGAEFTITIPAQPVLLRRAGA